MKRLLPILPVLLGFLVPLHIFSSPIPFLETVEIAYFQGSLSQLQAKARADNKPYIVYFYTDWCEPCQDLRDRTLANERVSQYLNDNYLSFRINADMSSRGEEAFADQFRVELFPTVLIFDPTGNLIDQFSGYKDSGELLGELKTHVFASAANPVAQNEPPVYQDRANAEEDFTKSRQPSPAGSAEEWERSPRPTSLPRGDGLYQMRIKRYHSNGYAVQLGVFKEYQNAIFKMEQARSYFDQEMLLDVNSLHNEPIFKVMYGPFKSQTEARAFMREYQHATKEAAVLVDLSWFK